MKGRFGPGTLYGDRRTEIADAPLAVVVPLEAMIDREAVTVVCSAKGWVRTIKGHGVDTSDLRYKEGDRERFAIEAETTDKLIVFATNGRFYTTGVDKLPGGRGHGDPLRLMLDMANDTDIVSMFVHQPGRKLLVAAGDGRGFAVSEDEVVAQTRAGKRVLNVSGAVEALTCVLAEGDHVAVLGTNRKMIVFPLSEIPEMSKGRGVKLQSYAKGGLADIVVFTLAEGLTVLVGDRRRTFDAKQLKEWVGKRAQAGRLPPHGFPRTNRFGLNEL